MQILDSLNQDGIYVDPAVVARSVSATPKPFDLSEAQSFIDTFQPDPTKLLNKPNSIQIDPEGSKTWHGSFWRTLHATTSPDALPGFSFEPFTFPLWIQQGIDGRLTRGFFNSDPAWFFGLDTDIHHSIYSPAWSNHARTPSPELLQAHNEILSLIPFHPSLAAHSPHGLYLLWLLTSPIPFTKIKEVVRELLKNSRYSTELHKGKRNDRSFHDPFLPTWELLPTPRSGLRVPARKWLLDPSTLIRLFAHRSTQKMDFSYLPRYPFDSFHATTSTKSLSTIPPRQPNKPKHSPERGCSVFHDPKSRPYPLDPSKLVHLKYYPDHFENGHTNEQLKLIIQHLKPSGASLDAVRNYVYSLLAYSRPLGYTGDLGKDPTNLDNRIQLLHNSCRVTPLKGTGRIDALDPDVTLIYSALAGANLLPKKRERSIRSFIASLLHWNTTHATLTADSPIFKDFLSHDPNYASYSALGFFPLPKTCMESWIKNYYPIFKPLLDLGILEPHSSGSSKDEHRCRHFRLHLPELEQKKAS